MCRSFSIHKFLPCIQLVLSNIVKLIYFLPFYSAGLLFIVSCFPPIHHHFYVTFYIKAVLLCAYMVTFAGWDHKALSEPGFSLGLLSVVPLLHITSSHIYLCYDLLLCRRRMTVHEALDHPWIQGDHDYTYRIPASRYAAFRKRWRSKYVRTPGWIEYGAGICIRHTAIIEPTISWSKYVSFEKNAWDKNVHTITDFDISFTTMEPVVLLLLIYT